MTATVYKVTVRESDCAYRDIVTDDGVHRDRDIDIIHSASATVSVTACTVLVWQSGCGCTQRQSACECVHRGKVTVTATVYTAKQCGIVTVQQWECDNERVHRDNVI